MSLQRILKDFPELNLSASDHGWTNHSRCLHALLTRPKCRDIAHNDITLPQSQFSKTVGYLEGVTRSVLLRALGLNASQIVEQARVIF